MAPLPTSPRIAKSGDSGTGSVADPGRPEAPALACPGPWANDALKMKQLLVPLHVLKLSNLQNPAKERHPGG